MFAGAVPRLAALLAQHGTQAVAAGLLSGAVVAGTGVATGLIHVGGAPAPAGVALLACPGSGRQVGRITAGQTLLVTARSADGSWLQVYVGTPGVDRAWAPAGVLRLQAAVDGLPTADCGATPGPGPSAATPSVEATVVVTSSPSPSPTPRPTRTPRPTASPKPTPKPTPTPVPTSYKDPNPPIVSELIASDNCLPPGGTDYLTVTVTDADDADAALTVRLIIDPPGVAPYEGETFSPNGLGTWEGLFSSTGSWTSGPVIWSVIATDASGNSTTVKSSTNNADQSYVWYDTTACPTGGP